MKEYKKYFIIPAEPELVYLALTTQTTIALWTGEEASMQPVAGSEFSLWSGSIVGKNLSFVPLERIEQRWYFGEEEEVESIVVIKLHQHKLGTSLELKHSNIPDEAYADIVDGWENTYMASLIDFYAE